ncbi:MAG: thioredoxin-like domain-containing protein, partial [Candidatus Krumholzibacteriia bacterium]
MPEQRIHAPEFPVGLEWVNTQRPLCLAELRGKVVLLDFWASCRIHCMHVVPELRRLEARFAHQLVVIGVHGAKYASEEEADGIRRAIERYGIEHPVVNDHDFRLWRRYAVRAWPTLVLIDPEGCLVGSVSGAGHGETIANAIWRLLDTARQKGILDERPRERVLGRVRSGEAGGSTLSFPGGVEADPHRDRLIIADTNHHRILITHLDGTFVDAVGRGAPGRADGTFEEAAFDGPQGMAVDGDVLYVAERQNHLVRRVDLARRTVTTVGGTGARARPFGTPGPAPAVDLNSPWDLVRLRSAALDGLIIAMAGSHQLWFLDLERGTMRRF